jgi:uncharacterized membrane protein YjjB (DUF3815 family)
MINWIQVAASFTGSMGFAYLFKLKGKIAFLAGFAGGFAWFVYLATGLWIDSSGLCMLLAGLALGIYAELTAIKSRVPRTVYIAVGIIPLIPGASLYYMMFYFFKHDYGMSGKYGFTAAVTAVAIAGGLLIATSIGDVVRYVRRGDQELLKKIWR